MTGEQRFIGREWVFDAVAALRATRGGVLVITGPPGCGKSAVARQLAQRSPAPSASYFCRAGDVDLLDIADHLSSQLSASVEGFGDHLRELLADGLRIENVSVEATNVGGDVHGVHVSSDGSGADALRRRVLTPLRRLRRAGDGRPVVVLVDALDEALALNSATDLPALLLGLREVHLIVTTRRDRRVLQHVPDGATVLDLVDDAPADDHDLALYVRDRLGGEVAAATTAGVVAAAKGNFLYARVITDALHRQPGTTIEDLPPGLPTLYRQFLGRELRARDETWGEIYRPLLGAVAVARGAGLTVDSLAGILGRPRSRVADALRVVSQFLEGPAEVGPFRLFHESFREFLHDDPGFGVYPAEADAAVADHLLGEHGGQWLEPPAAGREEERAYALAYASAHLERAYAGASGRGEAARLAGALTGLLTAWDLMEARVASAGVYALLTDVHAAAAATGERRLRVLADALDDAAHRIRADPELVAQELSSAAHAIGARDLEERALDRLAARGRPALILRWRSHQGSSALVRTLRAHESSIRCVCFVSESVAVSGDDRGHVVIWDVGTGEALHELRPDDANVAGACALDERRVALAFERRAEVRIVDVVTGEVERILDAGASVSAIAALPDARVMAACDDGTLRVVPVNGDTVQLTTPRVERSSVVVTSAQRDLVAGGFDVVFVDPGTRAVVATGEHDSIVSSAAISRDGALAATGDFNGVVRTWDVASGGELQAVKFPGEWIHAVAFAPANVVVGLDSGAVGILDPSTGATFDLEGHDEPVFAVAVSPSGAFALSGSNDQSLILWDLGAAIPQPKRVTHVAAVDLLAIAPDSTAAVSVSQDRIIAWDLESAETRWTQPVVGPKPLLVTFTSDGLVVTQPGEVTNAFVVELWDMTDGSCTERRPYATGHPKAIGGGTLVTCTHDYLAHVINLTSGDERAVFAIPHDTTWSSPQLTVSPSGERVAASNKYSPVELFCWTADGVLVAHELDPSDEDVFGVALTADERWVGLARRSGALTVWDVQEGGVRELWRVPAGQAASDVRRDATSVVALEGSLLVVAYADGHVVVWDAATGVPMARTELGSNLSCVAATVTRTVVGGAWGGLTCLANVRLGVR